MDTLAVQLTLPTTKRVVDFHHQVVAHAGRTIKTENPGGSSVFLLCPYLFQGMEAYILRVKRSFKAQAVLPFLRIDKAAQHSAAPVCKHFKGAGINQNIQVKALKPGLQLDRGNIVRLIAFPSLKVLHS